MKSLIQKLSLKNISEFYFTAACVGRVIWCVISESYSVNKLNLLLSQSREN